jgi:hypothetical protein
VKAALTVVVGELKVTAHVPTPEQPAPLHPLNVEAASAVAVSVTTGSLVVRS